MKKKMILPLSLLCFLVTGHLIVAESLNIFDSLNKENKEEVS